MSLYDPIATEVIRSLVWTNISCSNLSTSVTNRSTLAITDIPNREALGQPQLWFDEGVNSQEYIDHGAEEQNENVEVHVFYRPPSDKDATIRIYKRDRNHVVQEITRVVRQNRDNASGFKFIRVIRSIPLDQEDNPEIKPPYFETLIRIQCRKYREALT